MTWDDEYDVTPERSEDELRSLVGAKANRLRMRNRLRLTGATAAVLALLVGMVALAQDDGSGVGEQRVASDGGATTSSTSSDDDALASEETEATTSTTVEAAAATTSTTRRPATTTTTVRATTSTTKPLTPPVTSRQASPEDCTKDEGGEYKAATNEDYIWTVTQVWLLCSKPSVFSTDEDGMELRSDGTWFKLVRNPDGSYRRLRDDIRDHGTWERGKPMEPETVSYLISFHFDDGGLVNAHTRFAAKTSKMNLNNNGVWIADYIHAPANTVITG